MADAPDTPTETAIAESTPPVGISSQQIFIVAAAILIIYASYGVGVFILGDATERTSFGQSAINLACMAAGFYLGSSAGSRNKEHKA